MPIPYSTFTQPFRRALSRATGDRSYLREQRPPIAFDRERGFSWHEGYIPDREAYNCERWPNRLDCGGGPTPLHIELDTIESNELFSAGSNGCQNWYCVQVPQGQGMRVACWSWRFEDCREEWEPARHGFEGIFPGRHSNRSPVGWIPNCQYFVHLYLPEGTAFQLTTTSYHLPNASSWDPDRVNGWIFPAYGPIEALEWEPVIDSRIDQIIGWDYYLRCNGLGLYGTQGPNPSSRRLVQFTDFAMVLNRWIFSAHFNAPLATGWGFTPFHQDIWLYSPGDNFTRFPSYEFLGTEEQHRRFLFRLGTPDLRIYRIFEASQVPPHIYPPRGSYPFGGRDFAAGTRATYGNRCITPRVPPPLPPPRRPTEDPPMACCSCTEIEAIVRRRLRPLMQFLQVTENAQQNLSIFPEQLIETAGNQVYAEEQPKSATVQNLSQMIATIAASIYYRAGYHRFPAEVPELTAENGDGSLTTIEDAMGWQEWMIKELDAVIGKFPLVVQAEIEENQPDGTTATVTKELKFSNVAEAIRELTGLLLSIADDANAASDFALRALVEAGKAEIAALIAQDYAKANAQFLGYKGNPVVRTVKMLYNPGTPDEPEDPNQPQTPEDGNR